MPSLNVCAVIARYRVVQCLCKNVWCVFVFLAEEGNEAASADRNLGGRPTAGNSKPRDPWGVAPSVLQVTFDPFFPASVSDADGLSTSLS